MDHRTILIVSQVLITTTILLLAVLTIGGWIELWMVIAWSVVNGSLMALSTPAQNAIIPRLIDMRSMASAVAANSAIWNSMRMSARPSPAF